MAGLSCPLLGGFTGFEGNIRCQILGGGAGAPPSSYAPEDRTCMRAYLLVIWGEGSVVILDLTF